MRRVRRVCSVRLGGGQDHRRDERNDTGHVDEREIVNLLAAVTCYIRHATAVAASRNSDIGA